MSGIAAVRRPRCSVVNCRTAPVYDAGLMTYRRLSYGFRAVCDCGYRGPVSSVYRDSIADRAAHLAGHAEAG